jgi:hypothetical protein
VTDLKIKRVVTVCSCETEEYVCIPVEVLILLPGIDVACYEGLDGAGDNTSADFIVQLCEACADLPNRNQTKWRVYDAPWE